MLKYESYGKDIYNYGIGTKIIKLVEESGIDEPIDYLQHKYITVGIENDKLIGVVIYGELTFTDKSLPRFLHIIIAPEYKRSKKSFKMLKMSEKHLVDRRFDRVVVYMLHSLSNKEMKRKLALKFGYKDYITTEEGVIMYKNLNGGI